MKCNLCGEEIDASKLAYCSQYKEEFLICTDCYRNLSPIEIATHEAAFAKHLDIDKEYIIV